MTPSIWRSHLRALAAECDASAAEEQGERIREGWQLLASAPFKPSDTQPFCLPPSDAIEAMIEAEAFESAALSLISPDMGFLLSRGGNGLAIASVVLPGGEEDHTASGASPALALLSALALALLGGDQAASHRDRLSGPSAGARLNCRRGAGLAIAAGPAAKKCPGRVGLTAGASGVVGDQLTIRDITPPADHAAGRPPRSGRRSLSNPPWLASCRQGPK
ncbi:MAG: hypothetical protein RIQ46_1202 [Pseudomonadota bacterium]